MMGGLFMSKEIRRKHFGEKIINQVLKLKLEGKTNRQIATLFHLKNAKSVKNLLERHREKEKKIKLGIPLRKKGRPLKKEETLSEQVIRLTEEEKLLRSFLHWVERGNGRN